MKSTSIALAALLVATQVIPTSALAHEAHTHTAAAAESTDAKSIEHVMKAQFDKPEAPLKVAPTTVEGDFALAGWIQNDRGGRALLRKNHGQWSIEVCGGDGLKTASALASAGMSPTAATRLAQRAAAAEKKLPADQIRKFAMFDGIVKVEAGAHGAHGTAAGHPQ